MGRFSRTERTSGVEPDLLRPSLVREHDADGAYPYSLRALVLTAFIGGPYALAGLVGLWTQRCARPARELLWLALLVVLHTLALVLLARELGTPAGSRTTLGLSPVDVKFAVRHGGRLLALAFVGLFYLRHRRLYRALESLGRASPVATIPAIGCTVLSLALSGAILALVGLDPGSLK